MLFLTLFTCVFSSSCPLIKKNFDTMQVYQYQRASFYLYDYFEGYYLSFNSSNSSYIKISDQLQFNNVQNHTYPQKYISQSSNYYTYATWNDFTCEYLLDFMDSTIYPYIVFPTNKTLKPLELYPLNITINQIVIWDYSNETYAIILGYSDINHVLFINFTSFNCSDTKIPDPVWVIMWDINYATSISTCKVSGTDIIPFTVNFHNNLKNDDNSVLFLYNFSNPYIPILVYAMDNNYIINSNFQFFPIQVALEAYNQNNITIIALSLDYGILYFTYINGIFKELWPRVLIDQCGTFYSLSLVSSYYLRKELEVPLVIIVGTAKGLVAVDFYGHSVMFLIEGITSVGNNITGVINAVFIGSTYFLHIESNELMVILDRKIIRDYSYIVKLNNQVVNYSANAKWYVINTNGSFMYIRSDLDAIKTYNLVEDNLIFTIVKNIPSDNYYIGAIKDANTSCVNNMNVDDMDNLYEIRLCTQYQCITNNASTVQVIFHGLDELFQFYIYSYVSGWNMSFDASYDETSDIYSLNVWVFQKFSPGSEYYLRRPYKNVFKTDEYVVMQYSEGIDFYEMDFKLMLRSYIIEDIISFQIYNNLVYVLHGTTYHFISIYNPLCSSNFSVNSNCSMFTFCGNYLICGGGNVFESYLCINFICEFVSGDELSNIPKFNITGLSATNSSSQEECKIYVLSHHTRLYVLSMLFNSDEYFIYNLIYYNINPANQIYATPLRLFTFYYTNMTIYSLSLDMEVNINLNNTLSEIYFLENYAFISTIDNTLMIIDGLQIIFNMVYLNIQIPNNCSFSGTWFYDLNPYTGMVCNRDTGYYLVTNASSCPERYSENPCEIPISCNFKINEPRNVQNPAYLYNVTFLISNSTDTVSLPITFELLIYGQVIHYTEISDNKNITTFYDIGFDASYILDGFTGNNLTFNLEIDGENVTEQSEGYPLRILPNIFEINNYTSPYNIYSITAVANTPYIVIYDDRNRLIVLNSSYYNETTQNMDILGMVSLEQFGSSIVCSGIQYVSTKNGSFLIAAMCKWSVVFNYYWQSIPKKLAESSNYLVVLVQVSLTSFSLTWAEAFQIPFQPSQLKAVTDNDSILTLLLVDYIIDYGNPSHKNNRLYRAEFRWNGTILEPYISELIDMFSLGLDELYIYSVDGYYYKNLHIIVADKIKGMLILICNGNYTTLDHSIASQNDPIFTVGVAYKMIFTVSKSGILTGYTLFNHTVPVFSCNRYPFAQSINITTIPSFIAFSNYYWPQFLIFPVIYNSEGFYLRLSSIDGTALSFLIKDIMFSSSRSACSLLASVSYFPSYL
ncbi:hypothetical protein SteCoe_29307 [Stentor coeruleus]|uniref:Uncharacterized protein n=1 Tax=Stentor coeruleus TaxID=5963 RepID=A0A1R2B6B7_9CILI|nr:hypothetical protein SteCoe_29307 [Stentor coeruleus]